MLAAKAICAQRFEQFGCAGQAGKIAPIALDAMPSATCAASWTRWCTDRQP